MKRFICLLFMLGTAGSWAQDPFVTYWRTNPLGGDINWITLPVDLGRTGYDFLILWGDGTFRSWKDGDNPDRLTKFYDNPGFYQVTIVGDFPSMKYLCPHESQGPVNDKLLRVDQWGDTEWDSMHCAFGQATRMQIAATDTPDLRRVASMAYMFAGANSMNNDLNHWDVSTVTDMRGLFMGVAGSGGASQFNGNISAWNVSSVTNMSSMFDSAYEFNADISDWNVGNVSNMSRMFRRALSFNRNLSGWNVSSVTNMDSMFENIGNTFNPDIGNWNVGNVTSMERMFYKNIGFSAFNRNLGNWNIGKVESMQQMLDNTALSVDNYDATLLGWAAQSPNLQHGVEVGVQGLEYCMGQSARQFLITQHGWTFTGDQRVDDCPAAFITRWKTDNPGPSADNQITIPIYPDAHYDFQVTWGDGNSTDWASGDDPSLLTHTYGEPGIYLVSIIGTFPRLYFNFEGDRQKIVSVMGWGDIEWASMERAFAGAVNLDIFFAAGAPDLSQVTSTWSMFEGASSLTADLDHWDVSTVELMVAMFKDAHAFNGNIASWNVSNVISMVNMFRQAFSFKADIGKWNTSKVQAMDGMFRGADVFNRDLGSWDLSSIGSVSEMFLDAGEFDQNLGGWNIQNGPDMSNMLRGAGLSTANYDATLIGWSMLPFVPPFITLGAEGLVYCDANDARQQLIDTYSWNITGDSFCSEVDIDPPLLIAPDNLSDSESIPVTLAWQAVDLADKYQVQVTYATGSFDFPVLDSITSQTSTSAADLELETWYIWRVRALTDQGQYGDWSDIWYFSASDDVGGEGDLIFRDRFE